mmetsp:Transcript_7705/g.25428  ORF Transcript_7705/g.25428 Transcript_7705/m.25428 type:complete len:212 (-) Transcript_7705:752-1387(-)
MATSGACAPEEHAAAEAAAGGEVLDRLFRPASRRKRPAMLPAVAWAVGERRCCARTQPIRVLTRTVDRLGQRSKSESAARPASSRVARPLEPHESSRGASLSPTKRVSTCPTSSRTSESRESLSGDARKQTCTPAACASSAATIIGSKGNSSCSSSALWAASLPASRAQRCDAVGRYNRRSSAISRSPTRLFAPSHATDTFSRPPSRPSAP